MIKKFSSSNVSSSEDTKKKNKDNIYYESIEDQFYLETQNIEKELVN